MLLSACIGAWAGVVLADCAYGLLWVGANFASLGYVVGSLDVLFVVERVASFCDSRVGDSIARSLVINNDIVFDQSRLGETALQRLLSLFHNYHVTLLSLQLIAALDLLINVVLCKESLELEVRRMSTLLFLAWVAASGIATADVWWSAGVIVVHQLLGLGAKHVFCWWGCCGDGLRQTDSWAVEAFLKRTLLMRGPAGELSLELVGLENRFDSWWNLSHDLLSVSTITCEVRHRVCLVRWILCCWCRDGGRRHLIIVHEIE